MTDWNKLDLKKGEKYAEGAGDWDSVPEERGPGRSNLPAGRYEFLLPAGVASLWGVTSGVGGDGQATKHGARVYLDLSSEGLLVVKAPAQFPDVVGQSWNGIISGTPRNRARKGEPEVLVADLLYLLKYGFGYQGKKPASNEEMVMAVNAYAGKPFGADNEWTSRCDDRRVRYVFGEDGNSVEDPEGKFGCGARFYQRDLPRAEGVIQERFACSKCGASLRAFQNLLRFGLASAQ